MEVMRQVLSGRLFVHACCLCLRELTAGGDPLRLEDRVATSAGEMSVANLLDRVCREYKMQGFISNSQSIDLCLQCFRNVLQAFHRDEQYQPDMRELEHFVAELYEKIIDIPTLAKDADSIVIYVKSFEPLIKVKVIKEEPSDQTLSALPIKQELIDCEFEDIVILINETGRPDMFRVTDSKVLEELSDGGRVDILSKFSEVSRKKKPLLECRVCKKSYYSAKWLAQHTKKMHGVIACEECEEKFDDMEEYVRHAEQHAPAYTCDLCGQIFKFRHSITEHLLRHQERKGTECVCELCGVQLCDDIALLQHTASRHGPALITHTCYYCGRGYRGAASFEAHIRKHEMVQRAQLECDDCGAAFPSRGALRRHVLASHRARRPHFCDVCHKTFRSAGTLRGHRLTHERTRSHQCQMCGRGFVDARALTWHRRLHTGERPYACADCGRRFISRNRCNQHALTAHTAPARQCPFCPALFHLRSMVNSHIKKVHLKEHKRRSRPPRHIDVRWPTQKVLFEELSVRVQTELLDRSINREPSPPGKLSSVFPVTLHSDR